MKTMVGGFFPVARNGADAASKRKNTTASITARRSEGF
jgi:hypothetical protein